MNAEVT